MNVPELQRRGLPGVYEGVYVSLGPDLMVSDAVSGARYWTRACRLAEMRAKQSVRGTETERVALKDAADWRDQAMRSWAIARRTAKALRAWRRHCVSIGLPYSAE